MWVGALAGLLWLAVGGAAQAVTWFTNLGTLLEPMLPRTMRGNVWVWPGVWGYAAALLGACAVAAIVTAILASPRGSAAPGRAVAGPAWLAVIVAATVVGAAGDVAVLFGFGSIPGVGEGLRGRLSIADLGSGAAAGAYFGVLYGWIVALCARAGVAGATRVTGEAAGPGVSGRAGVQQSVLAGLVAAGAALVLVIAYTVVSTTGALVHTAVTQTELAQAEREAAEAAGVPSVGALPDPGADGEPVPSRDAGAPPRDPAWCSAEDTTLMFDGPDAATGHRILVVRVVNGGDAPCVLEGYPDIAFADQNGHLLDVELTHGSSFMRQDAGPTAITLEPGAWASSGIGWNANSTHNELVAAEVYSALVPGDERHAWPPWTPLDIVPGTSVAVSAWVLDDGPQPD